jgi:purine-binding chemotaxis protein CheW
MDNQDIVKYVEVKIGEQEFGIPVEYIIDIIFPQRIFPIPLTPTEILGSINLRGKIVTAIDIKSSLGIQKITSNSSKERWIIVKFEGELFSIVIDEIKEVSSFIKADLLDTPDNLSEILQKVSFGIAVKSDVADELVVILDVNKLLELLISKEEDPKIQDS